MLSLPPFLIQDEEELGCEIQTIEEFYDIWEGEELPILDYHPVTGYKIVSSNFLTTYKADLKKTRELEELLNITMPRSCGS